MEEFALIKSRVNLNRVNLGIALISDLKVFHARTFRLCASDVHCMMIFSTYEFTLLYLIVLRGQNCSPSSFFMTPPFYENETFLSTTPFHYHPPPTSPHICVSNFSGK